MPKLFTNREPMTSVSSSPSTPKRVPKARRDHEFVTPKSHHFDEDDNDLDSSPYSLSFSQRAMKSGAEVTWGKRIRAISSKSKPYVPQNNIESPPTIKKLTETDDNAEPKTPKGLFKFLKTLEQIGRSGVANSTTDDRNDYNSENTSTRMDSNDNPSHSTNYKQLLDDSVDMELIQCSQKIEQEISRLAEPLNKPIASKGFADAFSDCKDDDDFLLANLDDPLLTDDKFSMSKSTFARHKSISIQPNSSTCQSSTSRNANSNNVISKISTNPIKPASYTKPTISSTKSSPANTLVRHKSMPSPGVRLATTVRQCTTQEIEMKRQRAIAKLKQKKLELMKN